MIINEKLLKQLIISVLNEMPEELAMHCSDQPEQQSISRLCSSAINNQAITELDKTIAASVNSVENNDVNKQLSSFAKLIEKKPVKNFLISKGIATRSDDNKEIIIAMSPAFADKIQKSLFGIPHRQILKEILLGIELEKINYRLIRVYDCDNLLSITNKAYSFSGSGTVIALHSSGAVLLHLQRSMEYSIIEAFSDISLMCPIRFRQIGHYAALYLANKHIEPLSFTQDLRVREHYQQQLMSLSQAEHDALIEGKRPYEFAFN